MTPSEFAKALDTLITRNQDALGVASSSVIDEEPTVIGIDLEDGPELMVEVNLA
jgi:hypothetical protein